MLEDDQKRALKVDARDTRIGPEASRGVVPTSIGAIKKLHQDYGSRLLKELRVVILTTFPEYEAASLRCQCEGRQTCIVWLYEMRRVLGEAFLFEDWKDRHFDLEARRKDFQAEFGASVEAAGGSMLSLARAGYIQYMYDSARAFLLARVKSFFCDVRIILPAIKPVLARLHEDYAGVIPLRIQRGVDDKIARERQLARLAVNSTLNRFMSNMEVSFVTDLVNAVTSSVVGGVVSKVEEIYNGFSDLPVAFVREALNPFDFAWFQTQPEQFITGNKIRHFDMTEHVIDENNGHATTVLHSKRAQLTQQIYALFETVGAFAAGVTSDLAAVIDATRLQSDASVALLRATLDSVTESTASFTGTVQKSTLTEMEAALGGAMAQLEDVQGVRMQKCFDTKMQLIKDDLDTAATDRMAQAYQKHMDGIEANILRISGSARETYRQHVDEILEIEITHRLHAEEVADPVLAQATDAILADNNIISFSARQSTVVLGRKNTIASAALEVTTQRSIAVLRFQRKWANSRSAFRDGFMSVADDSKAAFREYIIGVTQWQKSLAVDIMGHVDVVIDALERELFDAMEEANSNIVDTVIGTEDNDHSLRRLTL